jgi:hypothetical protein
MYAKYPAGISKNNKKDNERKKKKDEKINFTYGPIFLQRGHRLVKLNYIASSVTLGPRLEISLKNRPQFGLHSCVSGAIPKLLRRLVGIAELSVHAWLFLSVQWMTSHFNEVQEVEKPLGPHHFTAPGAPLKRVHNEITYVSIL